MHQNNYVEPHKQENPEAQKPSIFDYLGCRGVSLFTIGYMHHVQQGLSCGHKYVPLQTCVDTNQIYNSTLTTKPWQILSIQFWLIYVHSCYNC